MQNEKNAYNKRSFKIPECKRKNDLFFNIWKKLPATKVTGKWFFPKDMVEQWIESNTVNHPGIVQPLPPYHGLLIISGSNDPLLEKTISLFNKSFPEHNDVFGSTGSMGGLRALKNNLCHMASCHLFSENENDYNFDFAIKNLKKCRL